MGRGTIMRGAIAATAALWLLAGCSDARPAAVPDKVGKTVVALAAPGAVTSGPVVAVLGVKYARLVPKPTATPKPNPKPKPRVSVPVSHPKPKASGGCVVGQPCSLAHVTWTKTVGCTKAWLSNQRKTNPAAQCPPGWPYLG